MKKDQKIKQIIRASSSFLCFSSLRASVIIPWKNRWRTNAEIPREMKWTPRLHGTAPQLCEILRENRRFFTGLMRFHSNSSEQMNGPSGSQMHSLPSSVSFFSIFCAPVVQWKNGVLILCHPHHFFQFFLPWRGLLRQICSLRCGYFFRSSSSMNSTEKKKHYSSIFFTWQCRCHAHEGACGAYTSRWHDPHIPFYRTQSSLHCGNEAHKGSGNLF